MSIIIAVKKDNRIAMGSDSKFSDGSLLIPSQEKINRSKLHKIPAALIGHVGNSAYHTILDFMIAKHPDTFQLKNRVSTFESMVKLHKIMVEQCLLASQGEEFISNGLNLLITTKDSIYSVDSDRSVDEYNRFWAIGSGSSIALGALEALYDQALKSEEIVSAALKITCKYDLHSNEEISVSVMD